MPITTITAIKKGASHIFSTVKLLINPTKTATDFRFSVGDNNQNVRKFICDENTARNMFGNQALSNGQLRDVFIIPKGEIQQEFTLDTNTYFDATIENVSFRIGSIKIGRAHV